MVQTQKRSSTPKNSAKTFSPTSASNTNVLKKTLPNDPTTPATVRTVPHPTLPTPPTASHPLPRPPHQPPLHLVSPALHLQQTITANTRSITVGGRTRMRRMEAIRATLRIIITMPSKHNNKEASREEHHLDRRLMNHRHRRPRVAVHRMGGLMP